MPFPGSPYDPTATMVAADSLAFTGLSSRPWRFATQGTAHTNPGYGFYYIDNFVDLATSAQPGTAGTAVISGPRSVDVITDNDGQLAQLTGILGTSKGTGNVALLDSETTTDTEGVAIAYPGFDFTPLDGWVYTFEARIAADSATLPEVFVGFHEDQKAAISSDAITASKDHFGGYSLLAGAVEFSISDGSTADATTGTQHTLVDQGTAADGKDWVKIAGVLHGTANANEIYINGVLASDTLTGTLGPNQAVSPIIECHSNGTTTGRILVDWFAFGAFPVGGS